MKVILKDKTIKEININNMKAIIMKKDNMIDLDGIKVMIFTRDRNQSSILTTIKEKEMNKLTLKEIQSKIINNLKVKEISIKKKFNIDIYF